VVLLNGPAASLIGAHLPAPVGHLGGQQPAVQALRLLLPAAARAVGEEPAEAAHLQEVLAQPGDPAAHLPPARHLPHHPLHQLRVPDQEGAQRGGADRRHLPQTRPPHAQGTQVRRTSPLLQGLRTGLRRGDFQRIDEEFRARQEGNWASGFPLDVG
jgi:hypothetical protein